MNHIVRLEHGWRLVCRGEYLQESDERLTTCGWIVMYGCLGIPLGGTFFSVRRKI